MPVLCRSHVLFLPLQGGVTSSTTSPSRWFLDETSWRCSPSCSSVSDIFRPHLTLFCALARSYLQSSVIGCATWKSCVGPLSLFLTCHWWISLLIFCTATCLSSSWCFLFQLVVLLAYAVWRCGSCGQLFLATPRGNRAWGRFRSSRLVAGGFQWQFFVSQRLTFIALDCPCSRACLTPVMLYW